MRTVVVDCISAAGVARAWRADLHCCRAETRHQAFHARALGGAVKSASPPGDGRAVLKIAARSLACSGRKKAVDVPALQVTRPAAGIQC
jgi:hypothetical protein